MSCHRVCSEMVSLLYEWNWLNVLSQSVHWNGFSQDSHLFLCEKGWNFLLWKQTFSWDNLIFESLIFQSWKIMHLFFCNSYKVCTEMVFLLYAFPLWKTSLIFVCPPLKFFAYWTFNKDIIGGSGLRNW